MTRVTFVEHGATARAALAAMVRDAQADDPLAPVTVLVASTYAGLALRRALALERGLANVRFSVSARLAELVAAPVLAEQGLRPLNEPVRREAIRAALGDAPGALAAVAGHPATERSLATSFLELRRAGENAVAALEERTEPVPSVARLYRAFRARLGSFYDEDDLMRVAARAVAGDPPTLRDAGQVVLYLPTRLTPGESELVEALAAVGRLETIIALTGDARADAPALALAARIGGQDGTTPTVPDVVPPVGSAILSAPDPEDEVRAVVRMVLERAAHGTPLHRVGVLYRIDEPYARLARELFDAAELPWTGPSSRRLADSMAGRVLLGLLRLVDADFARDSVAVWLASGPVLDPVDGQPVPAHRWDTISRHAGVVGGLEQWKERLARFVQRIEADLAAADPDELTEGARRRQETDLENGRRLAEFLDDLGQRVVAPEPATWTALASWARLLLDHYLGGEGRRSEWPESELDAARRVSDVLESLGALAEIRAETDPATFLRALEAELDVPLGRVGRFGTGVFVGRVANAYGGDFDVVYLLGMAEGSFPPPGHEDPLLPDRDRRAAGDALPLHATRLAEERRDYLAALASAPERVLSLPRADPRAQRKRLPSRWLLETADQLAGVTLGADELTKLPATPWLSVIPSFEAGVCTFSGPGSLTERDVRSLRAWSLTRAPLARHPLLTSTPILAAGIGAIEHRRSHAFTRFDGSIGAIPELLPDPARPVAPTALEDWATCPFRYLLGRVLRLREVERPEETESISALERGSLIHAVLEEFLDSVPPRSSPSQPWSADERALLLAIAERHCNRVEADGLTGRPLLWKLERRRILREIAAFILTDEAIREELGVVPMADGREVSFGFDTDTHEAVTLELLDGRTVRFRGRIDRVDRGPGGSPIVVFDYKTGVRAEDPDDGLGRGNRLQLPVYALAMGRLDPAADLRAYYWYVRWDGVDSLSGFTLDDDRRELFTDRVSTILDGIGEGAFPAYPGTPRHDARGRETFDNCAYCQFDRVCATARDQQWERKRDDPALVEFRDLAEPEVEDESEAAS